MANVDAFVAGLWALTTKAAWAAGLFEGEGCITQHLSRNPTRKDGFTNCNIYPSVQICMTDKDVLKRFRNIVKRGRVLGPYFDKNQTHKPTYQWSVVGKDAMFVIEMLKPFLHQRRLKQIDTVMAKCGNFVTDDPKYFRGVPKSRRRSNA